VTLLRRVAWGIGRVPALIGLGLWASWAVVHSSAMVARDIVAPSSRLAPGVLVIPLQCRTAVEVSLFSGLITLTPGTLVVGVHPSLRELWVHGMYARDPEVLRADLLATEARVLRALRGSRALAASEVAP
jgi:multicomponent Na+:H+ antiporter subunit E